MLDAAKKFQAAFEKLDDLESNYIVFFFWDVGPPTIGD